MAWTHKGIDINVTMNGAFSARIEDAELTGPSLDAIKAAIDKALTKPKKKLALAVIGLSSSQIVHAVLVGVNRTTREPQFEDSKLRGLNDMMADTPENIIILRELLDARNRRDAAEKAATDKGVRIGGWGRIEAGEYDDLLAAIEAKHKASST